jgi:hypothetical protein
VENGRYKGQFIVDALFVAFMVTGTAIVSVGLGVLGAYYAITGLLAAVNPARPAPLLRALVPNQGQASGD